ncbi:MAG TPA: tyrosine-type recombinase/integrase [Caldilineaceae bacterium]|nr:tyrosine-type recombinase/integrase [Caldilineaceae bacterium]
MSLQELVQKYLQQIASLRPAASTVRNYHYVFSHFLEAIGDPVADEQVQSAHLGRYLQSLNARRFAPSTRGEHFRKVRAFFHWAHKQGHLSHNPSQLFRLPSVRREGWVPAPEQVMKLLEAPPDTRLGRRDRLVLELLYGTGLRRSEMAALNLGDVDSEGGLWVRAGKGYKDRLQPLGLALQTRLQNYLTEVRPGLWPAPEENALLLTRTGQRLQSTGVYGMVKKYARALKMPQLTVHSLRRAYATHMLLEGAPLPQVQALLHHANPNTTIRYTQIQLKDLQQEYLRTHPRSRARKRPVDPGN